MQKWSVCCFLKMFKFGGFCKLTLLCVLNLHLPPCTSQSPGVNVLEGPEMGISPSRHIYSSARVIPFSLFSHKILCMERLQVEGEMVKSTWNLVNCFPLLSWWHFMPQLHTVAAKVGTQRGRYDAEATGVTHRGQLGTWLSSHAPVPFPVVWT